MKFFRRLLSIFGRRKRKKETLSQLNKIPLTWDQLPLEMKQAVVSEMYVRTRINLSMCSKSENQLVHSTKNGKVESITLTNDKFTIDFGYDPVKMVNRTVIVEPRSRVSNTYSARTDWRETIWNIMHMIGTKVTAEHLELNPDKLFKELFNWFHRHFHIKPRIVMIDIWSPNDDYYDESIFDWPSNTQIRLFASCFRLSNLERFNAYGKIVTFVFFDKIRMKEPMTDEQLKKLTNVKYFTLFDTAVTINGFEWWLKKWLAQKDDNEKYKFEMSFNVKSDAFSFGNVKYRLFHVIGKQEQCIEENFQRRSYWKIEIMKNGKVGGTIKLYSDGLIFESENPNPAAAEKNEQDAEMEMERPRCRRRII